MTTFRLLLLSPLFFFHTSIAASQPFPFQSFLHLKDEISERSVNSFDISSDEEFLATTNTGPNIYLWSIKDGNLVKKLTTDDWIYPMMCRFSSSGKLMSSSSYYGDARIWDLQTGKKIKKLYHSSDPAQIVRTLAFSPDDKTLLTSVEGNLFFWDVEAGILLNKVENAGSVQSAQYIPDSRFIFIHEASYGLIFDLDKGGITRAFPGGRATLSTDGQRVTTFEPANNETVNILKWDIASGAKIQTATEVEMKPNSIVSPDNDFVFYRTNSEKNKIKIKKLEEKSPFTELNLNAFPALNVEQPYRMELSKKGHFLFFSQGDYAFFYDIRELKSKIKDDKVYDQPPKKE